MIWSLIHHVPPSLLVVSQPAPRTPSQNQAQPQSQPAQRTPSQNQAQPQSQPIYVAEAILNGNYCGSCRKELFDADEVFECTALTCERVFHRDCLVQLCGHLYTEEAIRSASSEEWIPPEPWKCPSCFDICMMCSPPTKFLRGDAFFVCQHCKAEFHQRHWGPADAKVCYYCNMQM